jgi:hypothetical protein
VDRCYRKDPFQTDLECVEYLYTLYEKIAAPLAPAAQKPRKTKP